MKNLSAISFAFILVVICAKPMNGQVISADVASARIGSRWLVSPAIEPITIIGARVQTVSNEKHTMNINYSYNLGADIQRFILKRNMVLGSTFQLSRLSYSITDIGIAQAINNYADTRIYASTFNKRKDKNITFFKINTVLLNRVNFKNSVILNTEVPGDLASSRSISRNQTYGGIGFGICGYGYKNTSSGIYYSLDANFFFPLFSGGGFFNNNPTKRAFRTPDLFMARSPHLGAEISYRQYFNMKKPKRDDFIHKADTLFTRRPELLRPFVAIKEPKRSTFGGFYLEYGFKGRMDSLSLQQKRDEQLPGDVLSYNRTAAGYTLHFLGNHNNNQQYNKMDKGWRYNLYTSAGIQHESWMNRIYPLEYFRIQRFSMVGRAGFRAGAGKGLYFMSGYRYEMPLYTNTALTTGKDTDSKQTPHTQHGAEIYLGFRNAVYLGGGIHFTERLEGVKNQFWNNTVFLIRVGH
jgi:hypothetical protein